MPDSTAPGHAVPTAPGYPDPIPLLPRRRPRREPLPDAHAIRTMTVPEIAPPYDDIAAARAPKRRLAGLRGPGEDVVLAARSDQPRSTPRRSGSAESSPAGPTGGLQPLQAPQPGGWPSQFAQVLAETLAGSRPASQIVPWTTQQTRRRISQLGPMLCAGHRPRVRRVIVTSPADGVLEMTVVVAVGDHVRAVAVRMEHTPAAAGRPRAATGPRDAYRRNRSDWLCTAIEAA
jgi:uncharacterized protein DUF6459